MSENVEQVRQTFRSAEDVRPGEGLAPSGEGLAPSGDGLTPETDAEAAGKGAIKGAGLPLNDTGNGQRFAHYCGDRAMFVPRVGWHIWDGRRWKLDPDGIAVRRLAQSIQTRILAEIAHVALEDWQRDAIAAEADTRARHQDLCAIEAGARSPEQAVALEDLTRKLAWIGKLKDRKSTLKSDHRRFARTSGNKGRIDAMLTEATTSLSRDIDDLDADPLTVNTESGLLRFSVCGGADAEFARVPDGGGGYLTKWHEMPGGGRRWAAVWPAGQNKSDQEVSAARVANAVDYKLTVRTDRATRRVTSDWRVLLDGRPCAIKSVTRPDRGRGTITMIIQEGQPT